MQNYKMPVNDFLAIYGTDVINCVADNIKNDCVRLVIRAEPNSMRHDNPNWDSLYDPNAKNIITISKVFSRVEFSMASYATLIAENIFNCFKQLRNTAMLLYVAVEWRQYEVQKDGELKYKEFKEVILHA